jgi:hypothetical protein
MKAAATYLFADNVIPAGKDRLGTVKEVFHVGKPRRIGRRICPSGNSDVRQIELTRFGRRPVSWRKGRIVAGDGVPVAGIIAVMLGVL